MTCWTSSKSWASHILAITCYPSHRISCQPWQFILAIAGYPSHSSSSHSSSLDHSWSRGKQHVVGGWLPRKPSQIGEIKRIPVREVCVCMHEWKWETERDNRRTIRFKAAPCRQQIKAPTAKRPFTLFLRALGHATSRGLKSASHLQPSRFFGTWGHFGTSSQLYKTVLGLRSRVWVTVRFRSVLG